MIARISPALAAFLAAVGWWLFGTVATSPLLEAAAPPGFFDYFAYYRPNARYAFARLGAGDLPLWNPQQGFGLPFLATLQTGVLYPPNWLHVVLPTQLAFAILAAAHIALAAALATALARALGAGGWGALAAGLLFASSSWLLGAIWSPPTLYCAAWLPGVLLAVERIVERPTFARVAALAGALAMQGLTGWPYVLLMTSLGALLFGTAALVEVAVRERRFPTQRLLALAAGALAGALLAAPQLLPAAELATQSPRAFGHLAAEQTILLTGQHDPRVFLATLMNRGWNDGVPGVLALPLALVALLMPGCRRVRLAFLFGVGLFALLLSFPLHVPLYGWMRKLPLVGDFRFPFRYRLLTTLAFSVAAGVGVTRLESLLPQRWQSPLAAALVLALVAAVAPLLVRRQGFPREATWPTPPESQRLLAALASRQDGMRIDWQLVDETAWYYKVGQSSGVRVTHDLEPLTPAATARILTFFDTGIAGTLDPKDLERSLTDGAPQAPGRIPFFGRLGMPEDASRARILDLASVGTIVSTAPPRWLSERYRRESELGPRPAVFQNSFALPRAYRVRHAEAAPAEPEKALARLVAEDFDPHETVLLDAPSAEMTRVAPEPAPDDGSRTVFEKDEPEHQVIRTRGSQPAMLVVTDAFFPGWEATVDGTPAPILRANTAFRAVAVPPGEHLVELRYRPIPFRVGMGLACGVLVLGGASWIIVSARRRQIA